MERFTSEERELLKKLQAKEKRIKRAEKADARFIEEADRRKDELLMRWGIKSAYTETEYRYGDAEDEMPPTSDDGDGQY